jgi:hypothetical protein
VEWLEASQVVQAELLKLVGAVRMEVPVMEALNWCLWMTKPLLASRVSKRSLADCP